MLPGVVASDSDLVAELLASAFLEPVDLPADPTGTSPTRTTVRDGRSLARAAAPGGGVLLRAARRRPPASASAIPHGFRPLCLGRLGPEDAPEGWVLASESPALDVVGADLRPRARARRDGRHRRRRRALRATVRRTSASTRTLCIFEFVYFARPDSRPLRPRGPRGPAPDGRAAGLGRRRSTPTWSWACPTPACPPPRATRARSGIPLRPGAREEPLHRPDVHRPGPGRARDAGVRRKLNPLRENIAGKRLVVVDDSIVRGTTQRNRGPHAARGGRTRGAPAHLVAAVQVAVLLRHRHPRPRRAARRPELHRRDREAFLGVDSLAYLVARRPGRGDRRPGCRVLHGLPDRRLPGALPVGVDLPRRQVAPAPA